MGGRFNTHTHSPCWRNPLLALYLRGPSSAPGSHSPSGPCARPCPPAPAPGPGAPPPTPGAASSSAAAPRSPPAPPPSPSAGGPGCSAPPPGWPSAPPAGCLAGGRCSGRRVGRWRWGRRAETSPLEREREREREREGERGTVDEEEEGCWGEEGW